MQAPGALIRDNPVSLFIVMMGWMTYGTTQRRCESVMPATSSKRLAKRSHMPAKGLESLGGQVDGQFRGSERPIGGSNGRLEGLRGQLEGYIR